MHRRVDDRREESLLSRPFKRDEAVRRGKKLASLLKIQNASEFSPGINFQVFTARTAEQIRRRRAYPTLEGAGKFDALPVNKPKRLLRNVCVKKGGKKFLTVRRVLREFYNSVGE